MVKLTIHQNIKKLEPSFKMGVIVYNSFVVSDSPQMFKGRFRFFQEELNFRLEQSDLLQYPGIAEWRKIFKKLNIDLSTYLPSSETLFRKIKKGDFLPPVNSAVDMNNFFSLRHQIPFGIYDLQTITKDISIRIGTKDDHYIDINGNENNMEGKLISADEQGAFGSPIVDSKRTMVTEKTHKALHLVYLSPLLADNECEQLLQSVGEMFTQVNGGDFHLDIVT